MNPGVPQCKNCWKWGHATFSCRIQGSKCVKCNGPHKSEHHREFGWCCKANEKTNPPRLATKKGEPCPHSFKCSNCKGDHQADSNICPFWRHRFHREWHLRKYTEIRENRSNSIHSGASGANPQWLYKNWGFSHKTFERAQSSLTLYSSRIFSSTSSLSKNPLGPRFKNSQVPITVKENLS